MNDYITDLELTPDGDMLMGTADGCKCENRNRKLALFSGCISIFNGGKCSKIYFLPEIRGLVQRVKDFMSISESGFFHYKFSGFENINAIEEDSDGDVWLGTDNGLLEYDGSS